MVMLSVPPHVDEATARGAAMGVEEEFLLLAPDSGLPVARAAAVLDRASSVAAHAPDATLHAELLGTQVEAATGRCTSLADLRTQLLDGRRRLAGAARAEGALLVSCGAPVLGDHPQATAQGERFALIARTYAGIVADYQACGCHVHVGVPDRDTAVAVVNHLRRWLPTLLALSANSPFERGRDTGYASWRTIVQQRFPGGGVPPHCRSAEAYGSLVARLVDCGVLVDERMTFWMARPSAHLPTVELRAADAVGTVTDAVLQAALSRALVRTALAELAAGREAPALDDQILAAGVWNAARYGIGGPGVHPVRERPVPATSLLDELLAWVTPALEDSGDLVDVRDAVTEVVTGGTGTDHQRRAARDGPLAVVHLLAQRTQLADHIGVP
ncbi:carboxylate-amine ligase [Actinophytocola oryzae]|uniref:Putative glutamate--cysteine ligase 2 n=1 Tax=Actinophytocola oryzae TaxID=502181 RepID=A0A4R7V7V6_9PSEU|nr:glutamate--cysteine ligase [Actinophytocola oryzae]TDV44315.1 carboxylate-amine ligase [Actinophytocola oryzae]